MGLIAELMGDDHSVFDDVISQNQSNEYYQGKAEHILKQFDTSVNYFHFLNIIVKNFNESLNAEQKEVIKETMGIQSEIIYKEKIIIKNKDHKTSRSF